MQDDTLMQKDPTNFIGNGETFCPGIDLNNSLCSSGKESAWMKNPFLDRHKTSFPDFNSPSVFRVQPTPVASSKPFQWSVEDIAILRPADIDELPNQEVVDNSYFVTPRRAEASTKFFSMKNTILMTPSTVVRFANKPSVSSSLKIDSPNPYSFSRPPELLEANLSPTPNRIKTLIHGKPLDPATTNFKPTVTSLVRSCTGVDSLKKAAVDSGVQTMVTLPLDFDLGKVLSPYVLRQAEDNVVAPSIRRILFNHPTSSQTHDSAPPVEGMPSPIEEKKSPVVPTNPPTSSASPPVRPNRRLLLESPATWSQSPIPRSESTHSLPQQACPISESFFDHQETPKATKLTSNVSKLHNSRRSRKSSIKRQPVSSLDITPSTPSSLLMSLMSGKLECSNIHSPSYDLPGLSPISCKENPVNLEVEESLGVCSTPKPASEHDNSLPQSHQPIPMSPICHSSLQTLSTTYEATSTPLLEPKTPPSRRLTAPLVPSSPLLCNEDHQSMQQSPSCPLVREGSPDRYQDEAGQQEDPAPLLLSDISSVPDKLQAAHSLEGDSGIGSWYGEQSSLFHTQYKSRLKQRSGDHQLSFTYSLENISNNKTRQSPIDNSLSNDQVTKMRAKRNCIKVDSSPLSTVRRPLNEVQEPKRYQLDSNGTDNFNGPPSTKETEISNLDYIFPDPGVVQQQAKQIETIGKLRNFTKWNTHKKNIEIRTSNPTISNRSPQPPHVSPN